MTDILAAAHTLIESGCAVYFADSAKRPLVKGWNTYNALRDHDAVDRFFAARAGNVEAVGVVVGPSGLTVVDVDPKNDGDRTFRQLMFDLGYDIFENTAQVITPSNGLHCWYKAPSKPIHTRTDGLGMGVDLIGYGNGVIVPPSQRAEGAYVWRDGTMPDLSSLPDFPQVLIGRFNAARKKARDVERKAQGFTDKLPGSIPIHERNATLMRVGYKARWRWDCDEEELQMLLRSFNRRCVEPLTENEVRDMARSIARKPAAFVDPQLWFKEWLPVLNKLPGEFRVAAVLANLADFCCGQLTPSEPEMVRQTGFSRRHYYRARAKLVSLGALKIENRGRDLAPVFELLLPNASPVTPMTPTLVTPVSPIASAW